MPDLTHGPMHPDRDAEDADLEYWPGRVAATEGLGEPERRQYEWSTDYTADDYVELLATMSEIRLLDESRRLGFLREVGRTIDEHGGAFTMPMFVNAEIARAV